MLKMNKGKLSGVSWVKPSEPSFLKKFKNDVGYKEGPNVDTKRQAMPTPDDDSSGSDREDEQPQVVVLKSGDISAEEAKKIKDQVEGVKDKDDKPADGKILFKKPAKRSSSEKFQGITACSSKKKKNMDEEKEADKKEADKKEADKKEADKKEADKKEADKKEADKEDNKKETDKKEGSGKKVKNNSLLSFGGDEDDEED
ncbi:uncharacterized protein KIAA1143 homolog [Eucyclogobius newberryi]|uniref:uncharacterized protein KIAA1143 homolog n=1 Tax=Eucyclogobius newberryi TaxID=166745 RepID=UPI003B58CA3D